MNIPILPVVISGTNATLPKHSLNFHGRQQMRIRVLDPIPAERFTDMPVADLAGMVRGRLADALEEITSSR